jgi:L-lactate utilization protein LutB
MANINIRFNTNNHMYATRQENAITLTGPLATRGEAILKDDNFRENVEQRAEEHFDVIENQLKDFIDNAKAELAQQKQKFSEDLDKMITKMENEVTEDGEG